MAPGGRRLKSSPSGNPPQGSRAPPAQLSRAQQSARDKQQAGLLGQLLLGAGLRSIPKGPPKKKQELFTSGALKSTQFAPRGHGYYDAYVQRPESATVSATTGPATVVCGYSTDTVAGSAPLTGTWTTLASGGIEVTSSHTGNSTLIEFNPGSSDSIVGRIHTLVSSGGAAGDAAALDVRTTDIVVSQFSEFGPTQTNGTEYVAHYDGDKDIVNTLPTRRIESIPLRGSLRIRNITEALSVGGVVRTLRYNGGVSFGADSPSGNADNPAGVPTVQAYLSVCNMIRDAPRTKVHSGHELREMHQSNTYPADFIRSMEFCEDRSFPECVRRPGYCTLFVLIDDFAASTNLHNNTYEVNVMVQRAARFQMGSLLHGMARSLKVKSAAEADAHLQAEQVKPPLSVVGREGLSMPRNGAQLALTQ